MLSPSLLHKYLTLELERAQHRPQDIGLKKTATYRPSFEDPAKERNNWSLGTELYKLEDGGVVWQDYVREAIMLKREKYRKDEIAIEADDQ